MLDNAVFKKLAHNDTGAARGHQGGIVIPKDIAEFFPPLNASPSVTSPTVDARLKAELFVDGRRVASVNTRYQHQTWGGSRPAERRLTDNLGELRNRADKDDIVLFSKDLLDDSFIKIHLIRQGTAEYSKVIDLVGTARWGIVDKNEPPVSIAEITEAEKFIEDVSQLPASAFSTSRSFVEIVTVRKARDRAFRRKVLEQYDYRCAFTGRKFISPFSSSTVGLDAAHVVPVEANGSDHPANGMPLTKELHWAFDRGLIGVGSDRKIFVPHSVSALIGNEFLKGLHGQVIRESVSPSLRVLADAFDWHYRNVLLT